MNAPSPLRLPRRVESASYGGHRIARILGRQPVSTSIVSAVVDLDGIPATANHVDCHFAAYVDASAQTPTSYSDGPTAIHVLWTAPGTGSAVRAGVEATSPATLMEWDVAPGDTIVVPSGAPYAIGAGILAFVFSGAAPRRAPKPDEWKEKAIPNPPTHGLNVFDGYNRRTICAATQELALERWKITLPLEVALTGNRWRYLTNLAAPVALNWPSGSERLGRTAARLLPADLERVTIVPDGLAYVLISYVPHLENDVVGPLRKAGYNHDAIASLCPPVQDPP